MENFKPVNTKSLLSFIFCQMERLSAHEIKPDEASAQAKLASQACNLLNYELKRTVVQMQLKAIGDGVNAVAPRLREIESKAFDDAMVSEPAMLGVPVRVQETEKGNA